MYKDALLELGRKERHLAFLKYRIGRVKEMTTFGPAREAEERETQLREWGESCIFSWGKSVLNSAPPGEVTPSALGRHRGKIPRIRETQKVPIPQP